MAWLVGNWQLCGEVCAKVVLMYITALIGLRIGQRRTMAQWTIVDFATAVAIGAIIGRTAVASSQSFTTGAVALLGLLAVHQVANRLRFRPRFARMVDHRVRVLVEHGQLRHDQLQTCGLTESDLFAQLRQQGVFELTKLRYVLYESKGDLTIVPDSTNPDPELIRDGLRGAAR